MSRILNIFFFFHKKVLENFLIFFVIQYLLRIIPANNILMWFHWCEHHLLPAIYCARKRQVHLFIFCLTLMYRTVFVYTVVQENSHFSSSLYFDDPNELSFSSTACTYSVINQCCHVKFLEFFIQIMKFTVTVILKYLIKKKFLWRILHCTPYPMLALWK